MGTVKYSGPIVSFHCPTEATIRSLKVHFSPKQLGDGTPSPENVREIVGWDGVAALKSSKNLFDTSKLSCSHPSSTWNASTETNDMIFSNGELSGIVQEGWRDTTVFTQNIPFQPGTYTLSFDYINDIKNYSWKPVVITATYSGWYTAYKSVAGASNDSGHVTSTFTADKPFYISLCLNSFNYAATTARNKIYNIQLELGSTATPYEPYQGSTTAYEFGVLGKNKFNKDAEPLMTGAYVDYSSVVGEPIRTYSHQNYKIYKVPITPNTTYTFGTIKANDPCWALTDADNNVTHVAHNNGGTSGTTVTFTAGQNDCYLLLSVGFQSTYKCDDVLQLELGSTATAYEPYNPNKTVYGGWVDLVSGEVCETHYGEALSECNNEALSNEYNTAQTTFFRCQHTYEHERGGAYGVRDLMCETLKSVGGNWGSGDSQDNTVNTITERYNSYIAVCMRMYNSDLGIDAEDDYVVRKTKVNAYLAQHPVFICYKLRTPNVYYLTPTQLQTFLAQNNIWSNADYVEVEYDLHETQDILARKQFIVANQPHVEKLAAAPLQNFVTDMAAPLKECKMHFEPMQEGEGDPSPDNVRPISGWTKIIAVQHGENLLPHDFPETPSANYSHTSTGRTEYDAEKGGYISVGNGVAYSNQNRTIFNDNSRTSSMMFTVPKDMTLTVSFDIRHDGLSSKDWPFRFNYWNPGSSSKQWHYYTREGDAIDWTHVKWTDAFVKGARIRLTAYGGVWWRNLQLLSGDIDCDYVQKPERIYPIEFPSSVGEIPGGYVDLVKGEIVQTYYVDVFDSFGSLDNKDYMTEDTVTFNKTCSHYYIPIGSNGTIYQVSGVDSKPDGCLCNYLKPIYGDNWRNHTAGYVNTITCGYYSKGRVSIQMYNSILGITADESLADISQKISNYLTANPLLVGYKLAEPIHHTISPQTLKTLRGINNIWSSANDNIELSYWTH